MIIRHHRDPVLITNAEPSFEEEQRARKRIYLVLMVLHIGGFLAAGALAHFPWLALSIVFLTGPLPWVAVVLANDRGPRGKRGQRWRQSFLVAPRPSNPSRVSNESEHERSLKRGGT